MDDDEVDLSALFQDPKYTLYDGMHPHERSSITSYEAAAALSEADSHVQRERIRRFLREKGGATCDEVEAALGLGHQTASPRIRELVLKGEVRDSGRTRLTRRNRKAVVWIVNEPAVSA